MKIFIYNVFIFVLIHSLTFSLPVLGASPEGVLEEGIEWFQKRARADSRPTIDTRAMEKALDSFRVAFRDASDSVTKKTSGGYLLFAKYLKARYGELSDEQRFAIFTEGKQLGETLSETYPKTVPILYGTAAHIGRWTTYAGILSSARAGVAGQLRRLAQRIIRLDPNFDGGSGYRLLARVHNRTPYIPFVLSWPSEERARELMQKALAIAPNHPGNNFVYGEILHDQGNTSRARTFWKTASQLTPRAERPLVDRYAIYQSQLRLKKYPESRDS